MLSLLLALALQANADDAVLTMCDTPTITRECRTYLAGYIHAVDSYERLMQGVSKRGVDTYRIMCLPRDLNIDTARKHVVHSLKARQTDGPTGSLAVLSALAKLYPCQ